MLMLLNSISKLLFLLLGLLGATGKCTICRRSDFVCPTRCNCFGGLVFVRGMKAISADEDQRCLVCDLTLLELGTSS